MELTKEMLEQICGILKQVNYGRITFLINPEHKSLNYTVETTHKMSLEIYSESSRSVIVKRKDKKQQ